MLNAFKKWWHNERLEEMRERAKQQNSLINQQQKEISDLRKECASVRRGAKISQQSASNAYERGLKESTRLPWILWEKEQPFDHRKARGKLLLLMPSGKTLTAYVASKHKDSGGDMWSGTYMWLETGYGDKVFGTPYAWLPIELPEGFEPEQGGK